MQGCCRRRDLPCTHRTAAPLAPVVNDCLPFVGRIDPATPPYFCITPWHHIVWSESPVPDWVPFRSQFGMKTGKGVRCSDSPPSTDWTTGASSCTSADGCLPFVGWISTTQPPNLLSRPGNHLIRCKISVLGWMPLCSNIREKRCKRVGDRNLLGNTIRATSTANGATGQSGLPFVVRPFGT